MPSISSPLPAHRWFWSCAAVIGALIAVLAGVLSGGTDSSFEPRLEASVSHSAGPPWRYGPNKARFTIVLYADLECPYCQAYTPILLRWIASHPDVNLQWQHLPLPMHQPAAGDEARWVECVGEAFEHERFWGAVAWVYQHTRGGGQGVPPNVPYPERGDAVESCLSSKRPDAVVRRQADLARQAGVTATPSLRIVDHLSDRSILLTGPAEGDALLSALDLLASLGKGPITPELSADVVGDMPR